MGFLPLWTFSTFCLKATGKIRNCFERPGNLLISCEISGFHRGINEVLAFSPHLKRSRSPRRLFYPWMGPIGCPETPANGYRHTVRNNSGKRRSNDCQCEIRLFLSAVSKGCLSAAKVAEVWKCPLTSLYFRRQEWVEQYVHSLLQAFTACTGATKIYVRYLRTSRTYL
jgi:hypothetical protein